MSIWKELTVDIQFQEKQSTRQHVKLKDIQQEIQSQEHALQTDNQKDDSFNPSRQYKHKEHALQTDNQNDDLFKPSRPYKHKELLHNR